MENSLWVISSFSMDKKKEKEIVFQSSAALSVYLLREEVQMQVVDGETKKPGGHRERLKARFLAQAENAYSDEALLELLLIYALPQKDVQPLARHLLATFGTLEGVLSADFTHLTQQDGIKEHTAVLLKAVDWIRLHDAGVPRTPSEPLPTPAGHESIPQETPLQIEARSVEPTREPESVTPSLFSDLPEVVEKPSTAKKEPPARRASTAPANSGLFSNALLTETVALLPLLPDTASPDTVRAYLRQHLPFSSESTRARGAQYITKRMFPTGMVDRGLRLFAQTYADRQELRDACFYRFCKAEPLMAELIEQLLLPALGVGQIARSLIREYLDQHFPDYASTGKCALAAVDALVSSGLATADRETLRFAYREPSLAAFAFVVHSEFPEPGMFPIAKLEQSQALRTLLWQPASFLSLLYELRNQTLISKISEIDALRQFTTIYSLDQLCEHLASKGEHA